MFAVPLVLPDHQSASEPVGHFQWSNSVSAGFISLPDKVQEMMILRKTDGVCLASVVDAHFVSLHDAFYTWDSTGISGSWQYDSTCPIGFQTPLDIQLLNEGDCPAAAQYQRAAKII